MEELAKSKRRIEEIKEAALRLEAENITKFGHLMERGFRRELTALELNFDESNLRIAVSLIAVALRDAYKYREHLQNQKAIIKLLEVLHGLVNEDIALGRKEKQCIKRLGVKVSSDYWQGWDEHHQGEREIFLRFLNKSS